MVKKIRGPVERIFTLNVFWGQVKFENTPCTINTVTKDTPSRASESVLKVKFQNLL